MTMNSVLSHHTIDTDKMIQGILFSNDCLNFLGDRGCSDGGGIILIFRSRFTYNSR